MGRASVLSIAFAVFLASGCARAIAASPLLSAGGFEDGTGAGVGSGWGSTREDTLLSLTGKLEERGTGEPIPWATVSLYGRGGSLVTFSGQDGGFTFASLPPGSYVLRVAHVSYLSPLPLSLDLEPRRPQSVKVTLRPRLYRQNRIVAHATKNILGAESGARVLGKEDFSQRPGMFGDPLRALAPRAVSDFDARPGFRGAAPAEVGYYLDGMPLVTAYHFGGLVSIFPPALVERITYYPSSPPGSMGPATGGVIAIETKAVRRPRREAGVEFSPLSLAATWADSGYLVYLRRTYYDLVLEGLGKGEGRTVPNFLDGGVKAEVKKGKSLLTFSLFHSRDGVHMSLDGLSSASTSNRVTMENRLTRASAALKESWDLGEARGLTASLALAYEPNGYRLGIEGEDNERFDVESRPLMLSLEAELTTGSHRLQTGALIVGKEISYDLALARGFWKLCSGRPSEGSLEGDPVVLEGSGKRVAHYRAFYLEHHWLAESSWRLRTALRFEDFSASDESFLSPSFFLERALAPGVVYLSYGLYRAHPLDGTVDPSALGEGVSCRSSRQFLLGFRRSARRSFLIVELYDRRNSGLVAEVAPGVFASTAEGRSYGLEVSGGLLGTRAQLSGSYSFGRSFRRDPGGPLLRSAGIDSSGSYEVTFIHGSDRWYPGPYDQEHSFYLSGRITGPGGLVLVASWLYRSGAATTPVVGVVRGEDGRAFGLEGMPGSERLPAYHRLDVRLEKSLVTSWGEVESYVELVNAYNHSNVLQSYYDVSYRSRKRFFMLPMVPSLGVAVSF